LPEIVSHIYREEHVHLPEANAGPDVQPQLPPQNNAANVHIPQHSAILTNNNHIVDFAKQENASSLLIGMRNLLISINQQPNNAIASNVINSDILVKTDNTRRLNLIYLPRFEGWQIQTSHVCTVPVLVVLLTTALLCGVRLIFWCNNTPKTA